MNSDGSSDARERTPADHASTVTPFPALRFQVLGPLAVQRSDGSRLEVKGPSQRRVLAILLLHANSVLPAERLADWCNLSAGGIRTAVSRLRKMIGESSLHQEFPGYVLRTNAIDAIEFEQLVSKSRSADTDTALRSLDEALALWNGDAFADFAYEPWAQPAIARLNELRAAAREERCELLLKVGRWTDAIVGMEAHIAEFPLRDRPRSLLMRALAADGRQTEALRSYQTYRTYLAEEVGTEPTDETRAIEAKIVAGWRDRVEPSHSPTATSAALSQDDNTAGPPGNLRAQTTSFVGRHDEVRALVDLVRKHRIVTLTGIGGVGKTRLAHEIAHALASEFQEGAWMVELAAVDDPAALADVVAGTLGVTIQPDKSIITCLTEALASQHVLLVLDNCEHVLEAAASLIDDILASSTTVSIIATSREGTRAIGEHLWPVQPLARAEDIDSPAVQLFVERAQAVKPAFRLSPGDELESVIDICRRLDGIPLAIELAAARMLALAPAEVQERLHDRFRLLSGSPRNVERHQTLRQAIQWSYDLLTAGEQDVFRSCAVFAGGFDLAAITTVAERYDEFEILDALESLVRKSLLTVNQTLGRTRYSLLETIRHFAEDLLSQPTRSGTAPGPELQAFRLRHARYFADQAMANFTLWDGPGMREAADWVTAEFDNLRAGFRCASDSDDAPAAAAIAAHTPMIAFALQRLEPVRWAEELLSDPSASEVRHLPRLYTAASLCSYLGRHDDALHYAQAAGALHDDEDFAPFDLAWVEFRRAVAELDGGRPDRYLEICSGLAEGDGLSEVVGLCGLAAFLPSAGRADEAMAVAEHAMAAARAQGHPYWIAFAYVGYGRAFAEADPQRALDDVRTGLAYARDYAMPYWAAVLAREAGSLEAVHGDPDQAFALLSDSLESFHQAGNQATIAWTLASLAVLFERIGQSEVAATIYGTTTRHPIGELILGLPHAVERLRTTLGSAFVEYCDAGDAMTTTESVRYAREHISAARQPIG